MNSLYFEHQINNRVLTTVTSEENKIHESKNYLFDLSYLGILNILGDKSIEFLQGQLTCDMGLLSDIHITQGAQCNLKGRILSLVDIISWKGIKLILPKDLIEATINSLFKTAMLSRVSINQDDNLKVFGFYLQNEQDIIPDSTFFPNTPYVQTYTEQFCCYYLGNGFYIFIVSADNVNHLINRFLDHHQLLGSLTWHTLRLANGDIEIYPNSRGVFLPHRLNLHKTHYLSFNKGCYKGQEIIARMHYKSTIKHQMQLFSIQTCEQIFSGQKLFKVDEGTELGELVDLSILGHDNYLISVSLLKGAERKVLFEGHNTPIELKDY